eukprot:SAG11_NODE_3218_length_2603_cov_2.582268_2_plen_116_part_00
MAAPKRRADAHIHLFGRAFNSLPGVTSDDPVRYTALAETHGIEAALVVAVGDASGTGLQGYGENNQFVAELANSGEFSWVRPTCYLTVPELSVQRLELIARCSTSAACCHPSHFL